MSHHFDECEPSPEAKRHARWLLKKAGLKVSGVEPPEPLGAAMLDADARAIVDTNRDKIKEARLDPLQQSVEQLWQANTERSEAEIELANRINNLVDHYEARIARLESQVAHLTWGTQDIDPMVEANGCDRYARNWTKRTGGKLWRMIGGKGK
jgi:hypothetical protein